VLHIYPCIYNSSIYVNEQNTVDLISVFVSVNICWSAY